MKNKYLARVLCIAVFYTLLMSNLIADTKSLYMQLEQQGIVHFSDLRSIEDEHIWKLLVISDQGEQLLYVYDQETNTQLSKYSPFGPLDSFIRHQLIEIENSKSPLLASVWHRGVHGEQFILLDPLNDKVLYSVTSSWPLDFKVCESGITITVTGDNDKEGIPLKETHHWYNSELTQISHRSDQLR